MLQALGGGVVGSLLRHQAINNGEAVVWRSLVAGDRLADVGGQELAGRDGGQQALPQGRLAQVVASGVNCIRWLRKHIRGGAPATPSTSNVYDV